MRLLVLFVLLILFDLAVVFVYTRKFFELDTKMSDIYVNAGIEVSHLSVDGVDETKTIIF